MKVRMKQKGEAQVTQTLMGAGWTFSVTGRKAWANRMVKKYVPKIQRIARETGASKGKIGGGT